MPDNDPQTATPSTSTTEEKVLCRWGARPLLKRGADSQEAPVYLFITCAATATQIMFYVPAPPRSAPRPARRPKRSQAARA